MKISKKVLINHYILCSVFILTFACNSSEQRDKLGTTEDSVPIQNTKSPEEKFIGSWKYLHSIPNDNPNDHSMDGIICELEKYKSTQQTFVFHLFTGNDLVLSIKDDSTLTGENANMKVQYNDFSGHLVLIMPSGSKIVFSKLK